MGRLGRTIGGRLAFFFRGFTVGGQWADLGERLVDDWLSSFVDGQLADNG